MRIIHMMIDRDGCLRFLRKFLPLHFKKNLLKALVCLNKNREFIVASNGLKFINSDNTALNVILLDGFYERTMTNVMEKLIDNNDVVIDVGANFGWYTLNFAKNGAKKVWSYEPQLNEYENLIENIELNGFRHTSFFTRNLAAGASLSKGEIINPGKSLSSLAYVKQSNDGSKNDSENISIVPLDVELENNINSISYCKIDVEGYELNVLSGMEKLLSCRNPPIIQIELNDEALERAGASRHMILELLKKHRFIFVVPDQFGNLKETSADLENDILCFSSGIYADRVKRLLGLGDIT